MSSQHKTPVAAPIAPEDIKIDDFVCVLHMVWEHLGDFCASETAYRKLEPVRILWLPSPFEDGSPLKVVAVCLPFILTEDARGTPRTLDVRRYRLARVSPAFGKKAFKRVKRAGAKRCDSTI